MKTMIRRVALALRGFGLGRSLVWLLLAACPLGIALVVLTPLLAFSVTSSSVTVRDLRDQCDAAVGPDPSATTTTAGAATAAVPRAPVSSVAPTANPYAELTFGPEDRDASDWLRACATAMRHAPYQSPPVQTVNLGPVVECARLTAISLVDRTGAADVSVDAATFAALVIRHASVAEVSGCPALTTAESASLRDGSAAGTTGECSARTTTGALVLPGTVAAQSLCGQRVDPVALSPGDLVFWDYRGYAPTRVGVAVETAPIVLGDRGTGPAVSQIVSSDPRTGQVVQMALPTGRDVRVKRVLGNPA
ncbi:hypothetical protein [Nocardia sp. NPDC004722]